jgi:hypothetical protein
MDAMADNALLSVVKRDEHGRFIVPPKSPGRPVGARNKLGEAFIEALHDDFAEHGVAAIQVVRAEKPDQYLKVIASLLPKDVNLNVNNEIEMTDDELRQRIRELSDTFAPFLARAGDAAEGSGAAAVEGKPAQLH